MSTVSTSRPPTAPCRRRSLSLRLAVRPHRPSPTGPWSSTKSRSRWRTCSFPRSGISSCRRAAHGRRARLPQDRVRVPLAWSTARRRCFSDCAGGLVLARRAATGPGHRRVPRRGRTPQLEDVRRGGRSGPGRRWSSRSHRPTPGRMTSRLKFEFYHQADSATLRDRRRDRRGRCAWTEARVDGPIATDRGRYRRFGRMRGAGIWLAGGQPVAGADARSPGRFDPTGLLRRARTRVG